MIPLPLSLLESQGYCLAKGVWLALGMTRVGEPSTTSMGAVGGI